MIRTEQQALKISLVAVLAFSALGISFGLVSGSYAIVFDGVFSLVDALMSVVSIVVSTLILKSTTNALDARLRRRFTMGFWHFEPLVLAINALLMMSIGAYALVQSVTALLSGGRDIEFGPAVIYAGIVLVLTTVVGWWEHRANKRIKSALVAMDVKGWLMAGAITAALLLAFAAGMIIDGTSAEWLMPYVDPAILAVVSILLIPVPISTLRKSLAEIALVTPPQLQHKTEEVAQATVDAEGFSGFRAFTAQMGRAQQVELVFEVPEEMPAKHLQEWDRIRSEVRTRLGGEDPNHWITVLFTTSTVQR